MIRFYILAITTLMMTLLPPAASAEDRPDEYTIKAAILYKFIKYVKWPDAPSQINICVIGNDPFGERLDIIEKKSSPDLPIKIKRGVTDSDISGCQLAFVSASEKDNVGAILSAASTHAVLTISDASGFAESGGAVEFVLTDHKIKFVINLKTVNAARLNMNPQLLEISMKVIR